VNIPVSPIMVTSSQTACHTIWSQPTPSATDWKQSH